MIMGAQKDGQLEPGGTIVEATAGINYITCILTILKEILV
jgi:cysteine synthase